MAETARRDPVEPGQIVSGFSPIRSEVDVRPLMFALREHGARLCLPAILDKTTIVFRELVRGAAMVDMGFGTVGPHEDAEVLDPSLMLVPLAAFDARGHRIGYVAVTTTAPSRGWSRTAAANRRHRLRLPAGAAGSGRMARRDHSGNCSPKAGCADFLICVDRLGGQHKIVNYLYPFQFATIFSINNYSVQRNPGGGRFSIMSDVIEELLENAT